MCNGAALQSWKPPLLHSQVLDLGVVAPGSSSHTLCPLTYDASKLVAGPANPELQVCTGAGASQWDGLPRCCLCMFMRVCMLVAVGDRCVSTIASLIPCSALLSLDSLHGSRSLEWSQGTAAAAAAACPTCPLIRSPWALVSVCAAQVAIKTEQAGVLFLKDGVRLEALLEEGGAIDGASFLAAWKALPAERQQRLPGLLVTDLEAAKAKLQAANLFVLAHRPVGACSVLPPWAPSFWDCGPAAPPALPQAVPFAGGKVPRPNFLHGVSGARQAGKRGRVAWAVRLGLCEAGLHVWFTGLCTGRRCGGTVGVRAGLFGGERGGLYGGVNFFAG